MDKQVQLNCLQENLTAALYEVALQGYSFVPNALTPICCDELEALIATLEFSTAAARIGTVEQRFEERYVDLCEPVTRVQPLWRFALALGIAAQSSGYYELESWRPREVAIQRYPEAAVGIGPHRDFETDELLVVVVNLCGQATFNILEDDRTTLKDHWHCQSSDLVLLAGSGFGQKQRPVHSVTSVSAHRVSVTFRMTAST